MKSLEGLCLEAYSLSQAIHTNTNTTEQHQQYKEFNNILQSIVNVLETAAAQQQEQEQIQTTLKNNVQFELLKKNSRIFYSNPLGLVLHAVRRVDLTVHNSHNHNNNNNNNILELSSLLFQIVKGMVEISSGEIVEMKDQHGDLPLHIACRISTNTSSNSSTTDDECFVTKMIRLLVKTYPNAVVTQNFSGRLPLHELMMHFSNTRSSQVMDYVLGGHKIAIGTLPGEAAKVQERQNNCIPLHYAISNRAPSHLICRLIKYYSGGALICTLREGNMPLHLYLLTALESLSLVRGERGRKVNDNKQIDCDMNDKTRELIISSKVVSMLLTREVASKMNKQKSLVLHLAVSLGTNLPDEIFRSIIDAYPGALVTKNGAGLTPLHTLFWETSQVQVTTTVLQMLSKAIVNSESKCEESAAMIEETNSGMLPIHLACGHGRVDSESLKVLMNAHPSSLISTDINGKTPLHSMFSNPDTVLKCNPSLLSTILDGVTGFRGSSFAKLEDKNGNTALHLAILNRASAEIISILVKGAPSLCSTVNEDGNLPIHLLSSVFEETIASGKPKAQILIEHMIENKDSLWISSSIEERNGEFPVHIACKYMVDISTLERILDVCPGCFQFETKDGRFPIDFFEDNRGQVLENELDTFNLCSDFLFAQHPGVESVRKDELRLNRICKMIQKEAKHDGRSISDTVKQLWIYLCTYDNAADENDNYAKWVSKILSGLDPNTATELTCVENVEGRPVSDCANPRCLGAIDSIFLFLGHFELDTKPPIHLNSLNLVLGASYVSSNNSHPVVIKFITRKEDYEKEISRCDDTLEHESISKVLFSFVKEENYRFQADVMDPRFVGLRKENLSQYNYAIVTRRGCRDLNDMHHHEHLDLAEIKQITKHIGEAILFLHDRKRIHGDIRMRNIVRTYEGKYVLIDFEASCSVGEEKDHYCNHKNAYLPPFMFQKLEDQESLDQYEKYWNDENMNLDDLCLRPVRDEFGKCCYVTKTYSTSRKENTSLLPYNIVRASKGVDVWAFGVLLFNLLAGEAPFSPFNKNDILTSYTSIDALAKWDQSMAENLIYSKVKDPSGRDLLLHILVSSNNKDRIPSMALVLKHPFFKQSLSKKMEVFLEEKRQEAERWRQAKQSSLLHSGGNSNINVDNGYTLSAPSLETMVKVRLSNDSQSKAILPLNFNESPLLNILLLPYKVKQNKSGKLIPTSKKFVELANLLGKLLIDICDAVMLNDVQKALSPLNEVLSLYKGQDSIYMLLVDEYENVPIFLDSSSIHKVDAPSDEVLHGCLPFTFMTIVRALVLGGSTGLVKLIFEAAYPVVPNGWKTQSDSYTKKIHSSARLLAGISNGDFAATIVNLLGIDGHIVVKCFNDTMNNTGDWKERHTVSNVMTHVRDIHGSFKMQTSMKNASMLAKFAPSNEEVFADYLSSKLSSSVTTSNGK